MTIKSDKTEDECITKYLKEQNNKYSLFFFISETFVFLHDFFLSFNVENIKNSIIDYWRLETWKSCSWINVIEKISKKDIKFCQSLLWNYHNVMNIFDHIYAKVIKFYCFKFQLFWYYKNVPRRFFKHGYNTSIWFLWEKKYLYWIKQVRNKI